MNIAGEIIRNKQTSTPPPAHLHENALDQANVTMEHVRHFCLKYGKQPEEVVARFIGIDPVIYETELDKCIVLQREQAKLGLDVIKTFKTLEISGKGGGPIPLVLSLADERI